MTPSLRILIVEDSEHDVDLLRRTLRRGGYEVTSTVVETPEAMRAALAQQDWDVITSDHAMPFFNAPQSLALAKDVCPDVPFIVVSGELDLNLAVSLMREGAQDYIHKGELSRLVPAIERELRNVEARRARQQAEAALRERTVQLDALNHDLEMFNASVPHDLHAPLRRIDSFVDALRDDYAERLEADGPQLIRRIGASTQHMHTLIDALLALSHVSRHALEWQPVDLSALALEIASDLHHRQPTRRVDWVIADGLSTHGDARLLRIVLDNLLGNAWKFTSATAEAHIEVGRQPAPDGTAVWFVRDNGAGFDMAYADRLFGAFQRLHRETEFPGTGIGLATVRRIIHRHGGQVWAESAVNQGATFSFTLPGGDVGTEASRADTDR